MISNKIFLSRCHIPMKLTLCLSSSNPSFSLKPIHAVVRAASSNPKVTRVQEAKQRPDRSDGVKKETILKKLSENAAFSNIKNRKHAVYTNAASSHENISDAAKKDKKPTKTEVPSVLSLQKKNIREFGKYLPQEINSDSVLEIYSSLSKARLTSMVVATAGVGYAMAPTSIVMLPLLSCIAGTALSSAAANTINQIIEVPYDSQMSRTKTRALVRGLITPLNAAMFATVCSVSGLSILWFGVNPLVCGLGASNIILYAFVYTPLKRFSIVNTWVGAVVGAIPPLMGWAACSGTLEPNAFILAAILYAWQFPHFNALSWNYKPDYVRAGCGMTCICNEGLCRRTALRYSLLMTPICIGSSYLDMTSWAFAIESLPLNLYLIYLAYAFNKKGDSKSSRSLFRFSLLHLPLLMVLLILNKKYVTSTKKGQVL